jgi:hypothetical protein
MSGTTVFTVGGLWDNTDPVKQGKVFVSVGAAGRTLEEAIEVAKNHFRENCPHDDITEFEVYTSSESGNAIVEVKGNGPCHCRGLYKICVGIVQE